MIDNQQQELYDKVVHVGRVVKVVKGGRIFRFTATVVVGDMNGNVGVGYGKAREVPDAIRKGLDSARKNMVKIPLVNDTIPHEIIGKFGASEILMKPAAPGTGIIAGGSIRPLLELAGVKNILTKSLRSRNYYSSLYAAMDGFGRISTLEDVARYRGKSVKEIIG